LTHDASHGRGVGAAAVELHLRELAQLFDSRDPCPFHERDLDPDAEEYIVASARELRGRLVDTIVVHVDQPGGEAARPEAVEPAIRRHFARRTRLASRELRALVHRGWISLAIGLAFLTTLLVASETIAARVWGGPLAGVVRESLLIGGWVAMWKPLEIFLYDWWPIVARRSLLRRLSAVAVRVHIARDV
jgi:hypothetical protein